MPRLIGIAGFKRHGKDTAADYLVAKYGYQKVAFADALKKACAAAFDLPLNHFMDEAFKDQPCVSYPQYTNRYILQYVGSDLMRGFIDSIWVDTAMRTADNVASPVVFSDCRFDNECEAIRTRGGIIIRVVNPRIHHADGHSSERGVTDHLVDFEVTNDADVASLHRKLDDVLHQLS